MDAVQLQGPAYYSILLLDLIFHGTPSEGVTERIGGGGIDLPTAAVPPQAAGAILDGHRNEESGALIQNRHNLHWEKL